MTGRAARTEAERDAAFEAWLLQDGPAPDEVERSLISREWDRRAEIAAWVVCAATFVFLAWQVAAAIR